MPYDCPLENDSHRSRIGSWYCPDLHRPHRGQCHEAGTIAVVRAISRMSPIAISIVSFALILIGIVAGGWLQGKLPESHLSSDSKEVVKLSMGVMGTLAALVLGLLVASAQGSYAARQSEIKQLTAYLILLDLLLDQYGKDAESARVSLRSAIPRVADRIWKEGQSAKVQSAPFKAASGGRHSTARSKPSSQAMMPSATSRDDCFRLP